ncbi:MAG: choice-of-anchor D domain-containing protein [Myxococcales bacterium]|nr:choice-of-anchor D domain-containing protein [Myxococcales bacterium]
MRPALGLLAVSFFGCNPENKIQHVEPSDSGADPAPNVVITPGTLVFPIADVGEASTLSFNIANDGDADLNVSGIDLYGSVAYALITDSSNFALAPGEGRDIEVVYTGFGAEDLGQVHITDDDPGNPAPVVFLEGAARVPLLKITPNPLSFGKVLVGCHRDQPIVLENVGLATLTIDNIVQIGNGWSLDVPLDLPATLDPGSTAELTLTVTADTGDMDSQVWVTADDAVGTHVVSQTATGVTDPSIKEEFWQGDGPYDKGDILFYVDQSCSMRDDQAILQANFESFAATLDSLELSWQIGVVTRDKGCFNGGILTPDTPSVITAFTEAVAGRGGDNTEAGLILTDTALKESQPGGCNEGFIREGSKVTLVQVSDEVEQSPNPWNSYVTSFQAMAPTASVTAIVGDVPNGCGGGGRYAAQPGTGYYEASVATGGAFLSICATDWTSYFATIAHMTASGLLNSFPLSSEPNPATLTVQVDGSTSQDWTYDEPANSIVFSDDAIPEPGSHIVVYFDLFQDCSQ